METKTISVRVQGVKESPSGKSVILDAHNELRDRVSIFVPKSLSKIKVQVEDAETGEPIESEVDRFSRGTCFDMNVITNKQGDLIFDKDNQPVLDENGQQSVCKSDSLRAIAVEPMSGSDWKELVDMFR